MRLPSWPMRDRIAAFYTVIEPHACRWRWGGVVSLSRKVFQLGIPCGQLMLPSMAEAILALTLYLVFVLRSSTHCRLGNSCFWLHIRIGSFFRVAGRGANFALRTILLAFVVVKTIIAVCSPLLCGSASGHSSLVALKLCSQRRDSVVCWFLELDLRVATVRRFADSL